MDILDEIAEICDKYNNYEPYKYLDYNEYCKNCPLLFNADDEDNCRCFTETFFHLEDTDWIESIKQKVEEYNGEKMNLDILDEIVKICDKYDNHERSCKNCPLLFNADDEDNCRCFAEEFFYMDNIDWVKSIRQRVNEYKMKKCD